MSAASACVSGVAAGGCSQQQTSESDRFVAELGADRCLRRRAVIPLVEEQVQCALDADSRLAKSTSLRSNSRFALASDFLAARDPLLHRGTAGEKRGGDLAARRSRTVC